MKADPQDILGELYAIDPALREHEAELIPLLALLLRHDPVCEPSEQFVGELRSRLQNRAIAFTEESVSSSFMNKFLYAFGGAVAAVLIAVPAVYYSARPMPEAAKTVVGDTPSEGNLFAYDVTPTSGNAFGDLSVAAPGNPPRTGGGGEAADSTATAVAPDRPMAVKIAPMPPNAQNQSDRMMGASGLIDQQATEYSYVIDGEIPALDAKTVSVLKRRKGLSSVSLAAVADIFNVGLADLASFEGSAVESVSFIQDKQFGYMISLQLKEGMISMNQNWQRWPHPEQDCRDEACYRRYQLKIGDLLSDDQLLSIADAFMKDHGIDVSRYGKPEADSRWRSDYERMTDKSQAYVPDTQRVVYPLLVEGGEVFDEGGAKAGISLGVSVREKRVSDVWGLADQRYLQSEYEAAGKQAVLDFVNAMDRMPKDTMPPGAKIRTVEVTLGKPHMGYVKIYTYENSANDELMVPALIFPVKDVPKGEYFYRENIAVPLAKELLESRMKRSGGPKILE